MVFSASIDFVLARLCPKKDSRLYLSKRTIQSNFPELEVEFIIESQNGKQSLQEYGWEATQK